MYPMGYKDSSINFVYSPEFLTVQPGQYTLGLSNMWCVNHLSSLCLLAGLIRLRSSPPPHLQGVEYILNVTATDDNASGGPQALSSTAQVIVGVDDVNNNKPVFEKVRRAMARSHH